MLLEIYDSQGEEFAHQQSCWVSKFTDDV